MSWSTRAPGVHHRSGRSGRTLAIVGAVHGDEPAGKRVIQRLRGWPEAAWVGCPHAVVLAVGAPGALARGVRALPGRADLNRCFGRGRAPVGERARVLRQALADADVLIDLHQTHRPTPPLAVIPEGGGGRALARRLGLGVVVEGAGLAYGDAMLADWVARRGGSALTIELGGIGEPGCVDRGERIARALLFDEDRGGPQRRWRITQVLRAPGADLRFERVLDNESPVRAGERLGTSDGGVLVAPADGAVFLPREGVPAGAPAALFAEAIS